MVDSFTRSWCFTAWDAQEVGRLHWMTPKALVVALERCPETGKDHYQGYVRFAEKKRFSWWKSTFPTWHVEERKGSEPQARDYIVAKDKFNKEQGTIIHDYGCQVKIEKVGTVTEQVLDLIVEGAPKWQIFQEHPVFYFNNRSKIEGVMFDVSSWKQSGVPIKRRRVELDTEEADGAR